MTFSFLKKFFSKADNEGSSPDGSSIKTKGGSPSSSSRRLPNTQIAPAPPTMGSAAPASSGRSPPSDSVSSTNAAGNRSPGGGQNPHSALKTAAAARRSIDAESVRRRDLVPAGAGPGPMPRDSRASTSIRYSFAAHEGDPFGSMAGPGSLAVWRDANGNTALHIAAFEDRLEDVQLLVQGTEHPPGGSVPRIPVNTANDQGWTPLMCAAAGGSAAVVAYLLGRGADSNLVNADEGNAALHEAAIANSHAAASLLARHPQTDPNLKNKHGDTALHLACAGGFLESSAAIYGSGRVSALTVNLRSCTPLQLAALEGHFPLVTFLVTKGAMNPNVGNAEGATVLHLAVATQPKNLPLLQAIATQVPGIDVNAQDALGFTPLMRAIQKQETDAVNYFLSLPSIDVNRANALHIPLEWKEAVRPSATAPASAAEARRRSACFRDLRNTRTNTAFNRSEVQLCLEASFWSSAIHLACSLGLEATVQRLVEHAGASVDLTDCLNRSPLHVAVTAGHRRVVKYLIEQMGVDPELREGVLGWSALHIAAHTANLELTSYMIFRAGARVNSRARNGATPFVIARDGLDALADRSIAFLSSHLQPSGSTKMPRQGSVEMGAVFSLPAGPMNGSSLVPVVPTAEETDGGKHSIEILPPPPINVGVAGAAALSSPYHAGVVMSPFAAGMMSPYTAASVPSPFALANDRPSEDSTTLEFVLPAPDKETMKILAVAGSMKVRRAASETILLPHTSTLPSAVPDATLQPAGATANPSHEPPAPNGRGIKSCEILYSGGASAIPSLMSVEGADTKVEAAAGGGGGKEAAEAPASAVPMGSWAVPAGRAADGSAGHADGLGSPLRLAARTKDDLRAAHPLSHAGTPLASAAVSGPFSPLPLALLAATGSFKTPSSLTGDLGTVPPPGSSRALERILALLTEQGGCDRREKDAQVLLTACEAGNVEQVRVLVLSFASDVNVRCATTGRTPLHFAVAQADDAHREILNILAQAETLDVDATDQEGISPWQLARKVGNREACLLLRELGALEPPAEEAAGALPTDPRLWGLSRTGARDSGGVAEALAAITKSRLALSSAAEAAAAVSSGACGAEGPGAEGGAATGADGYFAAKQSSVRA